MIKLRKNAKKRLKKLIGKRIKLVRTHELALTQKQFGKWLGVHQAAISRIEKGEQDLTSAMAWELQETTDFNLWKIRL